MLLSGGAQPGEQAPAALIAECNGATLGEPCDTDDTVCTRETCIETTPGNVACVPDDPLLEPDGTLCESDGDPCTLDQCESGSCVSEQLPPGSLCFDGNSCTTNTQCNAGGQCVGGEAVDCDDDNSCTADSCDSLLGCQNQPLVGDVCDDGLFCTSADRCDNSGECVGSVGTCVDGNPCTSDFCDEDGDACDNEVLVGADCSDGDSCTADDVCDADGECAGMQLNDGSDCTAGGGCLIGGTCGPDGCTGTTEVADGSDCDDGDDCTQSDQCSAGMCGGMGRSCFDDDTCTSDVCEPVGGCEYVEIDGCRPMPPDAGAELDASSVGPDAGIFDGRLGGGGCGCRATGSGGLGGLLLAAVALGLLRSRRRRRIQAATLLLWLCAAAPGARAQGFEAQTFHAQPASGDFLSLGDARLQDHLVLGGRATLDLADDVLVFRDPDTGEVLPGGAVVSRRSVLHVGLALGLYDRFDVGLAVPVILEQSGDTSQLDSERNLGAGPGDVRVQGRVKIASTRVFDLAGMVGVQLPTGDEDQFAGDGATAVTPGLLAAVSLASVRLAAQLTYRVRDKMRVGGLSVGDEVGYGAGVSIPVWSDRAWALAELTGATGTQGDGVSEERPLEGLVGARLRLTDRWELAAGSGVGLGSGYGSPRVRGLLSLAYRPRTPAPPPPPIAPIVSEEEELPPPPVDSDGDGLMDPDDDCPTEPEDKDEFEDDDGCPDPDNDGDKIADVDDACPLDAEVVNGIEDEDGCPDEGLIVLVENRIVLEETVLFDTERARVKSAGRPVLKAIIDLFNQHPEWESIVVEGHADQRGPEDSNQRLSERRADRVKSEMVKLGLGADKIEAVGFGETRPRAEGMDDASLQKNRRVEFVMIERREELKVIHPGQDGGAPEDDAGGDAGEPAPKEAPEPAPPAEEGAPEPAPPAEDGGEPEADR